MNLDALSSATYATPNVTLIGHGGMSEGLNLVRPVFWVQERYDYRRIEHIWIAFRSIRQSIGGSRERFADYVADVMGGISNKQIIKYDDGTDWKMPARAPSPETLENFVNSISYSLKFLGIGGGSKFEASAKTISYIHVFLWQKNWQRMNDLESSLSVDGVKRKRIVKGLDESFVIAPPSTILPKPVFLVKADYELYRKHNGQSDVKNLDKNGVYYRIMFVIYFDNTKDREESVVHFLSGEDWKKLRGELVQKSTAQADASFKRWGRIGKGRATSVQSRQIVVNDETGVVPYVDTMIWQIVGALYDDLAKNVDYIEMGFVLGNHYRPRMGGRSSRRDLILKGGVCDYSGSNYRDHPEGTLLGMSVPNDYDIEIIKNICKFRG